MENDDMMETMVMEWGPEVGAGSNLKSTIGTMMTVAGLVILGNLVTKYVIVPAVTAAKDTMAKKKRDKELKAALQPEGEEESDDIRWFKKDI